jgi:hypothetical protein
MGTAHKAWERHISHALIRCSAGAADLKADGEENGSHAQCPFEVHVPDRHTSHEWANSMETWSVLLQPGSKNLYKPLKKHGAAQSF